MIFHQDHFYVVAASFVVNTSFHNLQEGKIMQYLSELQPFLPAHGRGSLRTGHVSWFSCLYQAGMNGCSKCFSMDKKIEQIAFPLKVALPASEHLDFKNFVHFLLSAQGELFKLLFPHGDPENSCHWESPLLESVKK